MNASETESRPTRLVCDTCGHESESVSRVVIDRGYNRSIERPMFNCPRCFQEKLGKRSPSAGE